MVSAMSDARKLETQGLTYWSPGPVSGTWWAIDSAGAAVIVGTKGVITGDVGTSAQRAAVKRAAELTEAHRHPECKVAERYGIPFGLETPCVIRRLPADMAGRGGPNFDRERHLIDVPGVRIVPFDRAEPVKEWESK